MSKGAIEEIVNQSPDSKQTSTPAVASRPGALASFSWLSVGALASRVLQFGVIVYLTRILGDAGFGRFSFAQAFLWYGIILAEFRLWVVGTREVAREPGSLTALASNILAIRLGLFVVEMLCLVLLLTIFRGDTELYWLFVFSFLSVLAYSINTDWVFRGMQRMEYIALWEALPRVIWLAGVLVFVHSRADLLRVPLLKVAGEFITVAALFAATWRQYPQGRPSLGAVRWEQVRALLKEGLPLVAAGLLVQVYFGFDVILITLLRGEASAGQYRAVYMVVPLLLTGAFLLEATYQPILARCFATDRAGFERHLRRLAGAAMAFGVSLPVIMVTVAVPMVRILFGAGYSPEAGPLAILMGLLPFAYLATAYSTALVAAGQQKRMMVGSAGGAVVNVVANLVLIPLLGMYGAALAAVVSFAVMAGLQWWFVNSRVCRIEPAPFGAMVEMVREVPGVVRRIRG